MPVKLQLSPEDLQEYQWRSAVKQITSDKLLQTNFVDQMTVVKNSFDQLPTLTYNSILPLLEATKYFLKPQLHSLAAIQIINLLNLNSQYGRKSKISDKLTEKIYVFFKVKSESDSSKKLSSVWTDNSFEKCLKVLKSGDEFEAILDADNRFIGSRRARKKKKTGLTFFAAWIAAIVAKGKISAQIPNNKLATMCNNQFPGLETQGRIFDQGRNKKEFYDLTDLIKKAIN